MNFLARSDLKLIELNGGFIHYMMAWSCMNYLWIIVTLLSAVWTLILMAHMHPLHKSHWKASWLNTEFLQICSNEETNMLDIYLHLGWPGISAFSANFHFGVNYFFKICQNNNKNQDMSYFNLPSSHFPPFFFFEEPGFPLYWKTWIYEEALKLCF